MPCYHHALAPQDPPDLFSRSSSPPKNISHQLSARSSRHSPQDPQHIPSQLQHSLSSQLLRLWIISSAQLMPSAPAQPEHTASAPQIFTRPTASAHISGKDAQLLSSQPRTVCAQPLSSSHQLQLLRLWLISPARPEHTASDPRHSSHSRSRIFSGASQLWEIQCDDLRVRMHQSRSDPRHSFPELRLWLSFRAFRSIRFAQYSCTPRAFQSAQPEQDPLYIVRAYTRAPVLSLLSLFGLIAKLVPSFRAFHQRSSPRSHSLRSVRWILRSGSCFVCLVSLHAPSIYALSVDIREDK